MLKTVQDSKFTEAQIAFGPPAGRRKDPLRVIVDRSSDLAISDDLTREVYCILGIPIDAIEQQEVLRGIGIATASHRPFVISTPNLNFLVNSLGDSDFRESLLLSDCCPADGVPIIWIARLMGLPIKHRIAGSDIFAGLKASPRFERPLKVFFFGATESVAAAAAAKLDANPTSLRCVGWICPGFGTVDELSTDQFIDKINSSDADFLVAALGAKKGQLWLQRNHHRLQIPVRAHLGATIHFVAGTIKRAPYIMRKLGFEWLWRIKEEPRLWRRYSHDGAVLIRLMLFNVLPIAILARSLRRKSEREQHDLVIEQVDGHNSVTLKLAGFAIANHAEKAILRFREVLATKKPIVIDFSQIRAVDARFLGLLLMVLKQLKVRGASLKLVGITRSIERIFRLHGLGYLLTSREGT